MPVENFDTGVKLTGEDAPLSTELDQWLLENPGYGYSTNSQVKFDKFLKGLKRQHFLLV